MCCIFRWGESAADEARQRGRIDCMQMLLANEDLYEIADSKRLRPFKPRSSEADIQDFRTPEDESNYPSDDEREINGDAIFSSVARRRIWTR